MAEWFVLWKDNIRYKIYDSFMRDVCVNFKGYSYTGKTYDYIGTDIGWTLPFKLTKEERDKYKVLLRLVK